MFLNTIMAFGPTVSKIARGQRSEWPGRNETEYNSIDPYRFQ